jgi:D-xylulose reductase
MKALVLESVKNLSLRDMDLKEKVGPYDVKIRIKACGICGSDIHYYLEGAIGDFIVKEPMVLGHEAAGVIVEKGDQVTGLEPGDLVCMEPGIPDLHRREVLEGNYNLDPGIVFWATPPVHAACGKPWYTPRNFALNCPRG